MPDAVSRPWGKEGFFWGPYREQSPWGQGLYPPEYSLLDSALGILAIWKTSTLFPIHVNKERSEQLGAESRGRLALSKQGKARIWLEGKIGQSVLIVIRDGRSHAATFLT